MAGGVRGVRLGREEQLGEGAAADVDGLSDQLGHIFA